MKTIKNILTNYSLFLLFTITLSFSSCSSNDDDSNSGSATAEIAGTYVGTLYVYPQNSINSGTMYDNAIVTVENLGNGTVKVSANKGNPTPKNITDIKYIDNYILGDDSRGLIVYEPKSTKKTIEINTYATAETDILFNFEGERQ